MNPNINFDQRKVIFLCSPKCFHMIHNGTWLSTILLSKFDIGTSCQILFCIYMKESNTESPPPKSSMSWLNTFYNPIVTAISDSVFTISRDFLLLTERWWNTMRVQISFRVQMRQSDGWSTFNGSPRTAFFWFVVSLAKPPKRGRFRFRWNPSHNLLTTARSEIFILRGKPMKILGFNVSDLNGRSASDWVWINEGRI